MCMEENSEGCGCHGACGCNATTDERIEMLELTRQQLLARARCMERTIAALKKGKGKRSRASET